MATCKKCLHYEACRSLLTAMGYVVDGNGENGDELCDTFKDKTKYVEQKHGRWEFLGGKHAVCTNCGKVIETHLSPFVFRFNYRRCISCGAKMDKECE